MKASERGSAQRSMQDTCTGPLALREAGNVVEAPVRAETQRVMIGSTTGTRTYSLLVSSRRLRNFARVECPSGTSVAISSWHSMRQTSQTLARWQQGLHLSVAILPEIESYPPVSQDTVRESLLN